jgi:hypothetical protein
MPTIRRIPLVSLIGLAVFLAAFSNSLFAQMTPATVERVEPPSWRMGPSSNVMLRLSGQHLEDVVAVKIKHKGVHVIRTEAPDENHLLVWLRISADATPGTMMLQVSTRFMTTFASVPMFGENLAPSSHGELTAGK